MKRYDEITHLLQNELGYELIESGKDNLGLNTWLFSKNGVETRVNEDKLWLFYMSDMDHWKKRMQEAEAKLLERLKNNPLRFD